MAGDIFGLIGQGLTAFTNFDAKMKEGGQLARMEEVAAKQKAALIRKQALAARSAATAAYAGSGVDVSSGTPATLDQRIAYDSEHDALMELLMGQRRAQYARSSGKQAGDAYALQTGASILSGWLSGSGNTFQRNPSSGGTDWAGQAAAAGVS